MIRSILKKLLAALLALWAALQLGVLGGALYNAFDEGRLLQQQIAETRQALDSFAEEQDISDQLKAMGYVYRGDIVFFDGG